MSACVFRGVVVGGLGALNPLALEGHDACLAIVHMDHVSLLVQDRNREPFTTDDVPRRPELAVQLVLNHLRGRLNHKEMEGGEMNNVLGRGVEPGGRGSRIRCLF